MKKVVDKSAMPTASLENIFSLNFFQRSCLSNISKTVLVKLCNVMAVSVSVQGSGNRAFKNNY